MPNLRRCWSAAGWSPDLMQPPAPGERISLRVRTPAGEQTDVVGEVIRTTAQEWWLRPWARGARAIATRDVLAWRRVPARTVRPSSSPADLARLAALCSPALSGRMIGGWLLRRGGPLLADRSALCEGEPEADLSEAIDQVTEFYSAGGGSPVCETALRGRERHRVQDILEARGWRLVTKQRTWVGDLRRLVPVGSPAHPDPTGQEMAVGLSHGWAVIRDHGDLLLDDLLHHAAGSGATFVMVIVEQAHENADMLRLGLQPHHESAFWISAGL